MACFHVNPSRLLTAAPIENTSDVNQKPLTESANGFPVLSNENCNVVAVTAEKNVATVERFNRFAAACFCANRMVGTPEIIVIGTVKQNEKWCAPTSMNMDNDDVMLSKCSLISDDMS